MNGEPEDRFQLYLVPVDGSRPPRRLNGRLASGGSVQGFDPGGLSFDVFGPVGPLFRIAAPGALLAYRADQDTDGVVQLHASPLAPQRLGTHVR